MSPGQLAVLAWSGMQGAGIECKGRKAWHRGNGLANQGPRCSCSRPVLWRAHRTGARLQRQGPLRATACCVARPMEMALQADRQLSMMHWCLLYMPLVWRLGPRTAVHGENGRREHRITDTESQHIINISSGTAAHAAASCGYARAHADFVWKMLQLPGRTAWQKQMASDTCERLHRQTQSQTTRWVPKEFKRCDDRPPQSAYL